jgi:hypothetical protein
MLQQFMNFLLNYPLIFILSRIKYLQSMRKLYKNSLLFPRLLQDRVPVFPSYENGIKTFNFRIKSGICKRSIEHERLSSITLRHKLK